MGRAIVKAVEYRARLRGNVADRIVFAHERLDCVDAVEPHQGLKLDLAAEVPLHEVDVPKTGDFARLDGRNNFGADDALIIVGILRSSPAAPETTDHQTRIGIRT